jgi:hypothetical protein
MSQRASTGLLDTNSNNTSNLIFGKPACWTNGPELSLKKLQGVQSRILATNCVQFQTISPQVHYLFHGIISKYFWVGTGVQEYFWLQNGFGTSPQAFLVVIWL